jgi:hypothetical protein
MPTIPALAITEEERAEHVLGGMSTACVGALPPAGAGPGCGSAASTKQNAEGR